MIDPLRMKEVADTESLLGKTIAAIAYCDAKVVFAFTDNTFAMLAGHNGYDGGNPSLEWEPLDVFEFDADELVRAGIVLRESMDAAIAERRARSVDHQQQWERKQYEQLKAKFEGRP